MDNYLGEIRLFAFGQIPQGWAACNGQTMQITSNQALYALLGLQYGGDGKTTFALPDLRGRVPIQISTQIRQGTSSGSESVTLVTAQLPNHNHSVSAYNSSGNTGVIASGYPAQCAMPSVTPAPPTQPNMYAAASNLVTISPDSVASSGSGPSPTPHENRQPTVAMTYCIAITGNYPMRNN